MKKAAEVLIETAHSEEERLRLERRLADNEEKGAVAELINNRQIFLEIMLVRHIENFLNYLSSLIYLIFVTRPETLKSSDKVEVSRVLEHESIESLVRSLAQSKVESLSYSSFSKLSGFFQDRFGLEITDESTMAMLNEIIEIRNIFVHSRCIINQRYVARMNADPELIGKKRELYMADLDRFVPELVKIVSKIDRETRKKLKVKGKRFSL
ncbi:hypothetical protein [Solemya velum gill symbiont]|uniref:hypothetical protein n=1 Tax=Solemya velum gill symbiont TaxID=2340 RepID=UPI00117BA45E|nr:hypothetical protein [Solemya velum gill symbiont]